MKKNRRKKNGIQTVLLMIMTLLLITTIGFALLIVGSERLQDRKNIANAFYDKDKNAGNNPEDYVIGTYRLMRKVGAKGVGKWYSQAEFDVEKFNDYDGEVLELGRACVHKDFRSKVVMQMLWNGLAAYMFDFDIKLMFGCGSFLGTDVNSAKEALSYLYYNHTADGKLEINARTENAVPYPLVPKEEIDERKAFISLPTMIKGYLRVGCKVSKSIFVDYSFNTFDVCIIFETKNLKQSYLEHYEKKIKG